MFSLLCFDCHVSCSIFIFCFVPIMIIVCDCVGWIVPAIRKCGQLTIYMAAFPNSHLVAHSKAVQVVIFLFVYLCLFD